MLEARCETQTLLGLAVCSKHACKSLIQSASRAGALLAAEQPGLPCAVGKLGCRTRLHTAQGALEKSLVLAQDMSRSAKGCCTCRP